MDFDERLGHQSNQGRSLVGGLLTGSASHPTHAEFSAADDAQGGGTGGGTLLRLALNGRCAMCAKCPKSLVSGVFW